MNTLNGYAETYFFQFINNIFFTSGGTVLVTIHAVFFCLEEYSFAILLLVKNSFITRNSLSAVAIGILLSASNITNIIWTFNTAFFNLVAFGVNLIPEYIVTYFKLSTLSFDLRCVSAPAYPWFAHLKCVLHIAQQHSDAVKPFWNTPLYVLAKFLETTNRIWPHLIFILFYFCKSSSFPADHFFWNKKLTTWKVGNSIIQTFY